MLTPEKIEELRGLLAKATPGPWKNHLVDDTTIVASNGFEIGTTWPGGSVYNGFVDPAEQHEINAALIVAMRNALPALLDLASKAPATLSLAGEDAGGLLQALDAANYSLTDKAAALIRSLSLRVEAEKRAREEVERELSEERLWSSRYCVEDYEVRNAIGERFCLVPPDGGDVKTWEAAAEMRKTLEAAETHSAALARALEEARDELLECKADYHRNPSSVIDKCNAVLAEARSLLAPKEDTNA